MAVRNAGRRAQMALLEPVMQLDITVGEGYFGAVTADLGRRRCMVEVGDRMRRILGEVPLDEARGYGSQLRNLTQGRCSLLLEFRRLDFVPELDGSLVLVSAPSL